VLLPLPKRSAARAPGVHLYLPVEPMDLGQTLACPRTPLPGGCGADELAKGSAPVAHRGERALSQQQSLQPARPQAEEGVFRGNHTPGDRLVVLGVALVIFTCLRRPRARGWALESGGN